MCAIKETVKQFKRWYFVLIKTRQKGSVVYFQDSESHHALRLNDLCYAFFYTHPYSAKPHPHLSLLLLDNPVSRSLQRLANRKVIQSDRRLNHEEGGDDLNAGAGGITTIRAVWQSVSLAAADGCNVCVVITGKIFCRLRNVRLWSTLFGMSECLRYDINISCYVVSLFCAFHTY